MILPPRNEFERLQALMLNESRFVSISAVEIAPNRVHYLLNFDDGKHVIEDFGDYKIFEKIGVANAKTVNDAVHKFCKRFAWGVYFTYEKSGRKEYQNDSSELLEIRDESATT